jgi:hypothetical protein
VSGDHLRGHDLDAVAAHFLRRAQDIFEGAFPLHVFHAESIKCDAVFYISHVFPDLRKENRRLSHAQIV